MWWTWKSTGLMIQMFFHEAPMIENWEFDVEDTGMNAAGPVAGPSSSFRSSSLLPQV